MMGGGVSSEAPQLVNTMIQGVSVFTRSGIEVLRFLAEISERVKHQRNLDEWAKPGEMNWDDLKKLINDVTQGKVGFATAEIDGNQLRAFREAAAEVGLKYSTKYTKEGSVIIGFADTDLGTPEAPGIATIALNKAAAKYAIAIAGTKEYMQQTQQMTEEEIAEAEKNTVDFGKDIEEVADVYKSAEPVEPKVKGPMDDAHEAAADYFDKVMDDRDKFFKEVANVVPSKDPEKRGLVPGFERSKMDPARLVGLKNDISLQDFQAKVQEIRRTANGTIGAAGIASVQQILQTKIGEINYSDLKPILLKDPRAILLLSSSEVKNIAADLAKRSESQQLNLSYSKLALSAIKMDPQVFRYIQPESRLGKPIQGDYMMAFTACVGYTSKRNGGRFLETGDPKNYQFFMGKPDELNKLGNIILFGDKSQNIQGDVALLPIIMAKNPSPEIYEKGIAELNERITTLMPGGKPPVKGTPEAEMVDFLTNIKRSSEDLYTKAQQQGFNSIGEKLRKAQLDKKFASTRKETVREVRKEATAEFAKKFTDSLKGVTGRDR